MGVLMYISVPRTLEFLFKIPLLLLLNFIYVKSDKKLFYFYLLHLRKM